MGGGRRGVWEGCAPSVGAEKRLPTESLRTQREGRVVPFPPSHPSWPARVDPHRHSLLQNGNKREIEIDKKHSKFNVNFKSL